MLVRAKRMVALGVMTLATAVISLPVVSIAGTSPTVTTLSPVSKGLRAPVKMVLDALGDIYVADQRVGGVVRFDTYGVPKVAIQTAATPVGLAFAQDGTLLVCQSTFVARYDVATGLEVGRLEDGHLQNPVSVAVHGVTGYLYVVDAGAKQVVVFNAQGAFVKAFAGGTLVSPTAITFEKVSAQFAVSDAYGNKIQFFDGDGVPVRSVGNPVSTVLGASVGAMQFAAPVAVAFEYSKDATPVLNRMYVVDAFQGNVQVVDLAAVAALNVVGTSKNYIGSVGTANGQLMVPSDAFFDAVNSRLLVVNGFGNITIYGIDGGKNPVFTDVTPPTFTINQVPAEVAVNSLAISGTVEAGSSVQVSVAGLSTAATVVSSSWSAVVTGLAAGNNIISVTATDAAGNISAPQVVNVSYLLPAPAVTLLPVSSITKSSTITLSGTVESGAAVIVANSANSTGGSALVVGTAWSYDVVLAEGANSLVVTAQKPQSAKASLGTVVTLDVTAPVLTVSALPNGSYTSTPVQNVSGTVADLNATTVTINGVPALLAGNAFSVPVSLVNGANVISVVAVDAAGNTTVDNRTVNFDAAKPYVSVSAPVDNSFTSVATLKISGSVDKASTVVVAGLPATMDMNNWSATVELHAGVNTIEIIATDLYGNTSSVKRSITLDNIKPALAVSSPAQDIAVNVPNVQISGTVSDDSVVTVEYTVNGTTATLPVIAGTFSFNVDFAAERNYPVTISAKDSAGNTSTVVRNVIYDITPPLFTLDQVNGAQPTKLSGTVEAGSSIVVKDGSVPVASVLIANGFWTADLTGSNYNPETLLAVATDAAGNSTSKALVYNFPDGTLGVGGKPTVQDALRAIRIVVNQSTPTAEELAHYDIGPLVNGKPNPNGKIEIVDAILILRKALGLKSW